MRKIESTNRVQVTALSAVFTLTLCHSERHETIFALSSYDLNIIILNIIIIIFILFLETKIAFVFILTSSERCLLKAKQNMKNVYISPLLANLHFSL